MTSVPDLPIAVIESSVLVPRWSRIALIQVASIPRPPFIPVWSEWIIAETWRVLAWRWLTQTGRHNDQEVSLLPVEIPQHGPHLETKSPAAVIARLTDRSFGTWCLVDVPRDPGHAG